MHTEVDRYLCNKLLHHRLMVLQQGVVSVQAPQAIQVSVKEVGG